MMPWFAIIFLCSAVSGKLSGREDVVYPTLVTFRSGLKIMKFTTLGQNIQLTLEPAGELISDELAVVQGGDQLKYSDNAKSLKSKLYRDKVHGAALHIDEDGPLTINGIISDKLRIKPYESKMRKDGNVAHRIVELQKEEYPRIDDGIYEKITMKASNQVSTGDNCVRIDYVFVSERNFTEQFENTAKLENYLGVMIVGMQNLFDTLNLKIKIYYKGLIVYNKTNEPSYFNENILTVNGTKYLETPPILHALSKYYCELDNFPEDVQKLIKLADIVMLASKRKFMGSKKGKSQEYEGMAFMGGVCKPCRKFSVCRDNADYNERVDTFAHESAHLLGSPHDSEGSTSYVPNSPGSKDCPMKDGHVMSNQQNKINKTSFSICSRKNIENLLRTPDYECLLEPCS